uniref:Uncharacterized protein n=1 Tax=Megaselia scalaris TaxID=36166 RepID=T1GFL7_MEGSC
MYTTNKQTNQQQNKGKLGHSYAVPECNHRAKSQVICLRVDNGISFPSYMMGIVKKYFFYLGIIGGNAIIFPKHQSQMEVFHH